MDKDGQSILNQSIQSGNKENSVNQIPGIMGDPLSLKSQLNSSVSKRQRPIKKIEELDPAKQYHQIDQQAV
jgi:hypothetical protein